MRSSDPCLSPPTRSITEQPLLTSTLALVLVCVITACQSLGSATGARVLTPGSTMNLMVRMTIPANRSKVDLRLATGVRGSKTGGVRCVLEVRNVENSPQEVPVGTYVIERTEVDRSQFVDERGRPHMLASNGLMLAGDGPSNVLSITSYFFEDGQAAGLYRLACSRPGRRGNFLSSEQIEGLLPGVVTFTSRLP